MKVKEIRVIDTCKIERLFANNNWYTKGSEGDYANMFRMCRANNVTTNRIYKIAKDIYEHSDTEELRSGYGEQYREDLIIADIMGQVGNCSRTFYIIKGE